MKFEWRIVTDDDMISNTENWQKGPLHITADLAGSVIQKVTGHIALPFEDDEKIFMNGYQTWTVCPEYTKEDKIRGVHRIPKNLLKTWSFDRYGDYHFVEYPYRKGITHGFSWCYFRKGDQYRLFASLDEEPGYTMFRFDANTKDLMIERDCQGVKINGTFHAFDLFFAQGSESEVFDAWFKALNIHSRTTKKLYGYSSWYNRYQDINAAAIHQDLNGCKGLFKEGDLFQIDDGWEPYVGDWLEPDPAKFPAGMAKMADEIHQAGFKAGLWLAPFVAEEKSSLYQNHQDWFLKVNGENWKNGSNWSGFYSLDFDNPDVQAYLRQVFARVFDEWGYDLVKLDFLYGAAPFGNARESRAGRMYRAMRFLREVCGDHLILGCGVPVMPAFGLADYCRISCDVSLDWDDKLYMRAFHRERTSTKNAIANIISRRELNGRAYLSDPDVFFLRTDNIKLSETQKLQLAQLDALLGGVFLTSDDPSSYTEDMKKTYREVRNLSEKAEHVHAIPKGKGVSIDYEIAGAKKHLDLFTK
jgi:alpha-galactosidase